MNQSAIIMLQKTIELMNKETCIDLMPEMIPTLLTVNKIKFLLFFFFYIKNFPSKYKRFGMQIPIVSVVLQM
jgi:hypothetical protein